MLFAFLSKRYEDVMKKLFCILFLLPLFQVYAQTVDIDGRLQSHLEDFFEICDAYGIEYHDKLFGLDRIDISQDLTVSPDGSTLGMLERNQQGKVKGILINWVAQLDPEILKVVAYHEFAHYFLEYSTHVCNNCEKIMAIMNESYFDIIQDWENQIEILFQESPICRRIDCKSNS